MLATIVILVLGSAAVMPFAVVSDPVVAGIFSACNTILNAITLYLLNKALTHSKEAAEQSNTARKIVDNRKEQQIPPPDHKWKRIDDPPGSKDE